MVQVGFTLEGLTDQRDLMDEILHDNKWILFCDVPNIALSP